MGTHPIFESDFDCLTENMVRPTEENNALSANIDVLDLEQMVNVFAKVDHQLFEPWTGAEDFTFATQSANIESLAGAIHSAIESKRTIVLGGCGTSGRLGFFVTRKFNRLLKSANRHPVFAYSLAGGDEAIFVSNEIVEDSPQMGGDDLTRFEAIGAYVGITCGLSAPYVAGQLVASMEKGYSTFLLGHNPPNKAKANKIEKWDSTFLATVEKLQQYNKGTLITPVFGGECISGSSRMKGGSGTLITLFTAFLRAMAMADGVDMSVDTILDAFKESIHHLYEWNKSQMVALIEIYGETLKNNGNVRYCGTSDYGVLALIDASECPPTFGADFNDIRGFILDGWQDMDNQKGKLEMTHEQLEITLEDCYNKSQVQHNTHLVLALDAESEKLIPQVKNRQSGLKGNIHYLTLNESTGLHVKLINNNHHKSGSDAFDKMLENCQRNLQCKLLLNTCSTGGHIVKGKVARNRMIDVKLTNSKLLERGTLIVSDFANVAYEAAKVAVLRSIHELDELDETTASKLDSDHIAVASRKKLVVPRAILLASSKTSTVEAANRILAEEPVVRRAILTVIN